MIARARSLVEALAMILAALLSCRIFLGQAADPTRWHSTLYFYGEPQDFTWGFSLAWGGVMSALFWLLNRQDGATACTGLAAIGRTGWAIVAACALALPGFYLLRPDNYSLAMAVAAALLALALVLPPRLVGLVLDLIRGRTRWRAEIAAAPRLVNMVVLSVSLLVGLMVLELFLRLHNPFALRLRGDRIVLQTLTREVVHNPSAGKMEATIIHSKNSLGFRGDEPPVPLDHSLSVIAVGGSTTEDAFLSDQSTWVAVAGRHLAQIYPDLWINNAGFAGHSTTAHALLLDDYVARLRPKAVLILAGINDLAKDSLMPSAGNIARYEQAILRENVQVRPLLDRLADHSELANLANILRRRLDAARAGLQPFNVNRSGEINVTVQRQAQPEDVRILRQRLEPGVVAYGRRLDGLIDQIKAFGGQPILITQPLLWGDLIDPDSGLDLARAAETVGGMETGSLALWLLLEDYNDAMRKVAASRDVPLIDLAHLLPKRSAYFIDSMHYAPAGAQAVGTIVSRHLCSHLRPLASTPSVSCP